MLFNKYLFLYFGYFSLVGFCQLVRVHCAKILIYHTLIFTIYLILGLIFISLLKEYNILDKRSVIYTIIFVFIYACSDEIHQLFVSGRSGEILDVLIDTTGGFIGTMIYKLYRRIRHE